MIISFDTLTKVRVVNGNISMFFFITGWVRVYLGKARTGQHQFETKPALGTLVNVKFLRISFRDHSPTRRNSNIEPMDRQAMKRSEMGSPRGVGSQADRGFAVGVTLHIRMGSLPQNRLRICLPLWPASIHSLWGDIGSFGASTDVETQKEQCDDQSLNVGKTCEPCVLSTSSRCWRRCGCCPLRSGG